MNNVGTEIVSVKKTECKMIGTPCCIFVKTVTGAEGDEC